MFILSLVDCCALIFLSVYFVSFIQRGSSVHIELVLNGEGKPKLSQ